MSQITNLIKKYWIILSIIALYFILAGLNFLPAGINIFKKQKLLINDTPVIVKEIRELGELATSEFYGEVYADINEVYDDLIEKYNDSIKVNPGPFYKQYSGLKEYLSIANNYRLKELAFNSEKGKYENTLTEHLKKLEAFSLEDKKLNTAIDSLGEDRKERRSIQNRLDDLRKNFEQEKNLFYDAQKRYVDAENSFNKSKEEFSQSKKNRNLVYIGRGWVKAGIDLKTLSEDDLIIEKGDSLSIQILISDPFILDADINPWFIYTDKKKVKGYEVFIAKTGSIFTENNFTDYEVTQLKLKCKARLKEDAINKGLLMNAKSSAVQTLKNFFRLIGFQKVDVHFKSNTIIETSLN